MIETIDFFPDLLKSLPVWVLWRLEERKGKLTKVPYKVNGQKASPTDPATWTTQRCALAAMQKSPGIYQGIGAVMSKKNRLVFIDIDHCILEDSSFTERAEDILEAFKDDDGNLATFAEVSQSGTGIHLIVIGEVPRCFNNRKLGVEMYDDGRFIAMTGKAIAPCEPLECETGIKYVFERYKTAKYSPNEISHRIVDPSLKREDDWIIQHARDRVGKSNKFPALFSGDWSEYESRSEADLALCNILAFWTNKDPEAIDRIFRRSGLYRAKWERKDYSRNTIQKAIASSMDTLAEFIQRQREKEGEAFLAEFR